MTCQQELRRIGGKSIQFKGPSVHTVYPDLRASQKRQHKAIGEDQSQTARRARWVTNQKRRHKDRQEDQSEVLRLLEAEWRPTEAHPNEVRHAARDTFSQPIS